MRRCNEAPNLSVLGRKNHQESGVQDLWMWISNSIILIRNITDKGNERRLGQQHQEHRHIELPEAAPSETALLDAGVASDQKGDIGPQEEARRRQRGAVEQVKCPWHLICVASNSLIKIEWFDIMLGVEWNRLMNSYWIV